VFGVADVYFAACGVLKRMCTCPLGLKSLRQDGLRKCTLGGNMTPHSSQIASLCSACEDTDRDGMHDPAVTCASPCASRDLCLQAVLIVLAARSIQHDGAMNFCFARVQLYRARARPEMWGGDGSPGASYVRYMPLGGLSVRDFSRRETGYRMIILHSLSRFTAASCARPC
jgi:hypothetical protein